MSDFRVAVIGGDGIGPEVIDEAIRVADEALKNESKKVEWSRLDWGGGYFLEHGEIMPKNGWETLEQHDAILLGAVGHPKVDEHETVHGLLLPMRRKFDQYVNYRPAYLYDGSHTPLRDKDAGSIDFVVYRENTEGEYAPCGGRLYPESENEVAVQSAIFTRKGCERIIRAAFEGAQKRKRKHVTSITKSNALQYGMVLWDKAFDAVKKEYPDVDTSTLLVDAGAMDFVRQPERFDVVVASNLFGDILTDLAAIVTGSMGLAASANLNPEGEHPSMFEPVHGSAPDIAGKGIANPLAAILSTSLMFEHLGLAQGAEAIRGAIDEALKEPKNLPRDLGGTAGTKEVGDAVIAALK